MPKRVEPQAHPSEIERARRFYAAAAFGPDVTPPDITGWRKVFQVLSETEAIMRRAHDMLIAEGDIRLREGELEGLRKPLGNLCERIAEVRGIIVSKLEKGER